MSSTRPATWFVVAGFGVLSPQRSTGGLDERPCRLSAAKPSRRAAKQSIKRYTTMTFYFLKLRFAKLLHALGVPGTVVLHPKQGATAGTSACTQVCHDQLPTLG
eukprot:GHRQ01010523.1.p1 GENE.GHRQ01010523.1~~GHRQ01010523.1.p1  ORF type:complete len:104 (-),score=5.24 GHRQ01010523.1:261-572(-)